MLLIAIIPGKKKDGEKKAREKKNRRSGQTRHLKISQLFLHINGICPVGEPAEFSKPSRLL
jgi:hypothetical protein